MAEPTADHNNQGAPGQLDDALNQSLNANAFANIELKPNLHGIAVRITDNFNKEENFGRYTLYVVKGFDGSGAIEIARRYSDFAKMRETFLIRWPGCYIPPIPGKNLLSNMESQFIRERRIGLDLFLQKVAEIPFLYNSKEFQTFLRYAGSDFAKEIKPFQKVFYDEMVARYAETFQHLAQIQSADEATILITRFKAFLNKMTGKFKTFKAVAKEAARAKKAYFMGIAQFQTMVAVDYEKEVLGEYQGGEAQKTVFSQPDNTAMDQRVNKLKDAAKGDSIENFYNWLNSESLEIEALTDAIKEKERIDSLKAKSEEKIKSITKGIETLASGKFYWKTVFSTKSKEVEVGDMEGEINKIRKDIENLTILGDMIVLIIAYDEFEKFKANKVDNFYNLVNTTAQEEINNLNTMTEYWSTVQQNTQSRGNLYPVLGKY